MEGSRAHTVHLLREKEMLAFCSLWSQDTYKPWIKLSLTATLCLSYMWNLNSKKENIHQNVFPKKLNERKIGFKILNPIPGGGGKLTFH